eukprot:TRINITY_DN42366_c0_g1_i1.p1 TRINITY_DN42366_c0_g1~~TRINITY_DN42366_c0_g1_i1.p1  ORF type:complete len:140 (+),score=18.44 TRINITY_DN42366_c0_g1_i1:54-473(+)
MKKITLALLMGIALFTCKKNKTTDECANKVCTEEFASLIVKFVDNKGAGAEVKNLTVVNQRTGENVMAKSRITSSTIKGAYIIVDDGNVKSLSEQGDDLKITGTSVESNQTKSAIIKVSGGKCACHINKISGAEQIAFD